MPTAFERTLERVQNGQTITAAVAEEYKSWRQYYDKATRDQRQQISDARGQYQYNKAGIPVEVKDAEETEDLRLKMPVSRKDRIRAHCKLNKMSMSRYINSLIIADLAQ